MKILASIALICAVSAPAVAQDALIYAPCLQQFPVPEELGELDDYIAAMEDAGWNHRTWSFTINRAAPPLLELAAAQRFPSRFRTVLDAMSFVDQAHSNFGMTLDVSQVFARDGVSASVSSYEFEPGQVSVVCTFAGMDIPEFETMFADTLQINDEFAVALARHEPELPPNATLLTVTALRFTGPEALLDPLSMREGISISYRYTAPA